MTIKAGCALFLAASLLVLDGCGPDRVAGGSIETTNGIEARVVLPSGQPASSIKVYLLDEQNWLTKIQSGESLVLDSAETDSIGHFEFKKRMDTTHTASLYANVETYGCLIHNVSRHLVQADYKGKIGLTRKVSYEGLVGDKNFGAKRIYLSGSPFAADVDSNGHFTVEDAAQEQYAVVVSRKLPDQPEQFILVSQINLNEWTQSKPDTILPDTTKSFLLESFENKDGNQNLLTPALGGGSTTGLWEANDDQFLGGNSKLLQPANDGISNFGKAIKDGGGGTGLTDRSHSLQVLYTTGTHPAQDETIPWVRLANNIGGQSIHYNFSAMDSLTFFAKGSGKLIVELLQQNPPPNEVSLSLAATLTLDLGAAPDSNWHAYSINPDSMSVIAAWFPSDPKAYKAAFEDAHLPAYTEVPKTWKEMGGMITQIRFKGTGGTEFWLDEIRVHGMVAGDLAK